MFPAVCNIGVEGSVPDRATVKQGETSAEKAEETTPPDDTTYDQRVEKGRIETQRVNLMAWVE